MEKIVEIDGKQVKFKSTGAVPMRYKMQFQRDFLTDLLSLEKAFKGDGESLEVEDIRQLDFDVFYFVAWVFAKTADSSISEPLTWLDGFDTFPIIDILPQIEDMLTASIMTTKKK